MKKPPTQVAAKAKSIAKRGRKPNRFAALRGTRKSGMSTADFMNMLRGYDEDARDPGFRVSLLVGVRPVQTRGKR